MTKRVHPGSVIGSAISAAILSAFLASPAQAQSAPVNPAPCTVAPLPAPCGSTPASSGKSNTPNKFPFPGEDSNSGGTSNPLAPAASSSDPAQKTPEAPGLTADPSSAQKSSGANFPFPGEDSKPAPNTAGSSGSSSSSSSGPPPFPDADPDSSSDAPALKDKGSEGSQAPQGRHILHRVNPIGTKLQNADEREAEDLDIAHYYVQAGDLRGAYLRGQDAVKTAPDDPDAHFALAEIALKLNKPDEAIAEYTQCLKLDPPDKQAKAARKQLARLKP